jgi:hypothetical protein
MIKQPSTQDIIVEVPRPVVLLGSVLIISGIIVTLYVASQVFQVYQEHAIDNNPFVSHIMQLISGSTFVEFGGQAIVVGEAFALSSAVGILVVFAWLGISLGISLIKAGAHIVSPAYRTELASLKLKVNRLSQKANEHDS